MKGVEILSKTILSTYRIVWVKKQRLWMRNCTKYIFLKLKWSRTYIRTNHSTYKISSRSVWLRTEFHFYDFIFVYFPPHLSLLEKKKQKFHTYWNFNVCREKVISYPLYLRVLKKMEAQKKFEINQIKCFFTLPLLLHSSFFTYSALISSTISTLKKRILDLSKEKWWVWGKVVCKMIVRKSWIAFI